MKIQSLLLCVWIVLLPEGALRDSLAAEGRPAPAQSPGVNAAIDGLVQSAKSKWEAKDYQGAMEAAVKAHGLAQRTLGPESEKTKSILKMIEAARNQIAALQAAGGAAAPKSGAGSVEIRTYTFEQYMEAMEQESAKFSSDTRLMVEPKPGPEAASPGRGASAGKEKALKARRNAQSVFGNVNVMSYLNGQYFPEEAAQDAVEQAATMIEAYSAPGGAPPELKEFEVRARMPADEYRKLLMAKPPKHAIAAPALSGATPARAGDMDTTRTLQAASKGAGRRDVHPSGEHAGFKQE